MNRRARWGVAIIAILALGVAYATSASSGGDGPPVSVLSLGATGSAPGTALTESAAVAITGEPDIAHFNPANGQWHLRYRDGHTVSLFYGVPGDTPLMGDWDCDGTDTVAMYRESTGFIYYRNWNIFGVADGEFFFGIPGDIPIAGDWDNDGCDTFGVYRNGKVLLSNVLGTAFADEEFWFGVPGDRPFAGDFNGDGTDTVGLHRPTSGFVYLAESLPVGDLAATDNEFFYGVAGDRILADDWDLDGDDTVGIYRPGDSTFYLSYENVLGEADKVVTFGESNWLPTGGDLVPRDPGDTVNCDFATAPEAQEWFDYYFHWYGDVATLDGDSNGVPCEDAGWHIDLEFRLAPDNSSHGVEWGPDSGFSDMASGDSCASGGSWVPPGPGFPFDDIIVTAPNDGSLVRFDFGTPLAPVGAWVHLSDGSCLTPDSQGGGAGPYFQFDSTPP